MTNVDIQAVERYLAARHGTAVTLQSVQDLSGESSGEAALKQFGYGRPLLLTYTTAGGEHQEVLHRIRENAFGRERADDRVAAVWLDYHTFNQLPHHVPVVDMLIQTTSGELRSVRGAQDLLLVTTFQPGELYAQDLMDLRDGAAADAQAFERAERLASYLAEIHQRQHASPPLWRRRLRDLLGHGEGIMGLTDSYPADFELAPPAFLRQIEDEANRWRWRLKPLNQRLCQVHGDFHPFNIGFDGQERLFLLDRSRGAWGEAADDVSCLSINYIFFSLQHSEAFEGDLRRLHQHFWEVYLEARPDEDLTAVIQPWLAWRALVLASPLWYPTLTPQVRQTLLTFARRVLASERYDFKQPERYWEGIR